MDAENVPAQPCAHQTLNPDGPPLFSLGRVVATPAALAVLERHGVPTVTLLHRHQRGDWGDLDKYDRIANDVALVSGSRLLSVYMVMGDRIWVITEAVGEDGTTRASSCILLPEEY